MVKTSKLFIINAIYFSHARFQKMWAIGKRTTGVAKRLFSKMDSDSLLQFSQCYVQKVTENIELWCVYLTLSALLTISTTTTSTVSTTTTTTSTVSITTTTTTNCPNLTCSIIPSVLNLSSTNQAEQLNISCSSSLVNMTVFQGVQRNRNETFAQQYQSFMNSTVNQTFTQTSSALIFQWFMIPNMVINITSFPHLTRAAYFYTPTRSTRNDTWTISAQSICGTSVVYSGTFWVADHFSTYEKNIFSFCLSYTMGDRVY